METELFSFEEVSNLMDVYYGASGTLCDRRATLEAILERAARLIGAHSIALLTPGDELCLLAKAIGAVLRENREREQCYRDSRIDPLTQILNRRAFDETVGREIARSRRSGEQLSIALLDLDHFKAVNDTDGHLAGDMLLAQIAAILHAHMRSTDQCFRIGGDEFAVILPRTSAADASHALRRIADAVEGADAVIKAGVGVSVGVAEVQGSDNVRTLFSRADALLYRDKASQNARRR